MGIVYINIDESDDSNEEEPSLPDESGHSVIPSSETNSGHIEIKETKFTKYWRPLSAYVFLIIVIFDFIIMPVLYVREPTPYMDVVELTLKYKSDATKLAALAAFTQEVKGWDPLTLRGNGTFYLAFTGLLSASAFTRGQEKTERLKRGIIST